MGETGRDTPGTPTPGVARSYARTCELRLLLRTPHDTGPRLQQRWVCVEDGGELWEDVPTVVGYSREDWK